MYKILLAMAVVLATSATAAAQELRRISTCFEEFLAPLGTSQLEDGIAHCDKVIEDKAAPAERRGQTFAQRGLMYGRRWALLSTPALAAQGIADLTEAFELHTPQTERRHQLLLVRAQLHKAVGQTRRALADYTAILNEDPNNSWARQGRSQLGSLDAH